MRTTNDILRRILVTLCLLIAISHAAVCEGATHYVSLTGGHVSPFTSWANAATTIQDAVDACVAGDSVLVTNGIYASGYRIIEFSSSSTTHYSRCRVVVTNEVVVNSVNGSSVTIIAGQGPTGPEGVRGVYLSGGAQLSGFTVRNGHTHAMPRWGSDYIAGSKRGGGIYCGGTAYVSNCVVIGNKATYGGGVYGGTLSDCVVANNQAVGFGRTSDNTPGKGGGVCNSTVKHCEIIGNKADGSGGGAYDSELINCIIRDNHGAHSGGGAYDCILKNCLVTDNRAIGVEYDGYQGGARSALWGVGGGASRCELWNCTVINNDAAERAGGTALSDCYNSIIYWNRAPEDANWAEGYNTTSTYTRCCISPLPPSAANNVSAEPALVSLYGGWLTRDSICCDAGDNALAVTACDIDGQARTNNSVVDIGADEFYLPGGTNGLVSVDLAFNFPWVQTGVVQRFESRLTGSVVSYTWDMGDGTIVSNRPFVEHGYSVPGDYRVVLQAEMGGYSIAATSCVEVCATISNPISTNRPVHFVSKSGGHVPPFSSWADAATNIQSAIDVSIPGDLVLVTNGLYDSGKTKVFGMPTRVAITRPITVRSVNGLDVTIIKGGSHWDANPIRCAYLFDHATLEGFSLLEGSTWGHGNTVRQQSGGGAWCEDGAQIIACQVTDNKAYVLAGGVYGGLLRQSEISRNEAYRPTGQGGISGYSCEGDAGGVYGATLEDCEVLGNYTATRGGGLHSCMASDCIIQSNKARGYSGRSIGGGYSESFGYGGGAYNSTLDRCIVMDNNSGHYGGGAYGGTMRSCLVTGNEAYGGYSGVAGSFTYGSGGGMSGGTMINCTVMGNSASDGVGGSGASSIRNSILVNNTSGGEPSNYAGDSIAYSLSVPLPPGIGNLEGDPLFVDSASGNYRLQPLSPCLDAGQGDSAVVGLQDLDGMVRIQGDAVDMGCCEFDVTQLHGYFEADYLRVLAPGDITFTAHVSGGTGVLTYAWDVDGDGVSDYTGLDSVVHTYAQPGLYTVSLTVSDEAGDSLEIIYTNLITITTPQTYVSPAGGNIAPYTNWSMAAHALDDAYRYISENGEVVLDEGAYSLSSEIEIDRAVTIRGRESATSVCVTAASGERCFGVYAENCVLRDLTVQGGDADYGGGIYVAETGGLYIEDLVIRNNSAIDGAGLYAATGAVVTVVRTGFVNNDAERIGGAVYCSAAGMFSECVLENNRAITGGGGRVGEGSLIEGCVISGNEIEAPEYEGGSGGIICIGATVRHCRVTGNVGENNAGGIFCYPGSLVEHCVIVSNRSRMDAGGICAWQSTVRNCLVEDNTGGLAGGMILHEACGEYCTIVDNELHPWWYVGLTAAGGMVADDDSVVQGCIVWDNISTQPDRQANVGLSSNVQVMTHSCTTPLPLGSGNMDDDPQFVDAANSDYRLRAGSSCIDAGTNRVHVSSDLDGNPRPCDGDGDGVAISDLGAYEYSPPKLIVDTPHTLVGRAVSFAFSADWLPTQYAWTWGDGSSSTGLPSPTHSYVSGGVYTVVLQVANALHSVSVTTTVSVSTSDYLYVSKSGSHEFPYDTWALAATNIQAAIDVCPDGMTVLVTNGVYDTGYRGVDIAYSNYYVSTSYYSRCRIMVTNDITVESVNGPEQTVIVGEGPRAEEAVRCAYLDGDITLSGFTLTGGHAFRLPVTYYDAPAGCLLFHGGGALCLGSVVISNCIVSDNEATYGGGISRGTVVDSVIRNNRAVLTEYQYYGDWSNAGRGGGVYKSTVLRCDITGNCAEDDGAGAYDSTLTQCRVTDNYGAMNGGGASACDLIDCFIANNRAISIVRYTYGGSPRGALLGSGGGAYASRLWNCTVINNDAAAECGGLEECRAWNSIVYWNRAPEYPNYRGNLGLSSTFLTNCCATPLATGAGNTDSAPALASLSGGQLTGSSVCRDSGDNAWVKTAEDLDGNIRTNNGVVDMGAYEYAGFNGTNGMASVDFDVLFPWIPTGFVQRFESQIEGSVLSYTWDMGDGTVVSNIPFVEHSYAAPGSYDVVLRADLGGWPIEQTSRIEVLEDVSVPMGTNAVIHFVSKDGGHVPPFTSWANAATTIQAAINASMPGDVVLVSNGVYRTGKQSVGGMPTRVAVTRPITVRSVNGPEGTTIEGGYCWDSNPIRCAYLFYDAQLIGFTLTNGSTWGHGDELYQQCGGGVFCEEGAKIEDCRVMKNRASLHGGGVYQGTVHDTLIQYNSVYKQHGDGPHYGKGGGASGCYLQNCLIISNTANECGGGAVDSIVKGGLVQGNRAYSAYQYPHMCHYSHSDGMGGGLYNCRASHVRIEDNSSGNYGGGVADSIVRFSTISGNSAIQNYSSCMSQSEEGQGGGVYGGITKNCIISNNVAGSEGGGAAGAVLYNCLISDNEVSGHTHYYGMSSYNETYGQGGGVSSSRVVNCTVIDNRAEIAGGGAYQSDLYNSIVCYNTSPAFPETQATTSTNCWFSEPGFVSRHNPHLMPGSPCINAGNNDDAIGRKDLDRNPRIMDNRVDIGAYEFSTKMATGALDIVVHTDVYQVLNGVAMEFEATVDGMALGYMWAWGDGTFNFNTYKATHTYTSGGSYTIMFYAWNSTHVVSVPVYVTVLDVDTLYVSPSGGHVYPYDSWENAATNIPAAAGICGNGMTIWVTNGHYRLDSSVELNASAYLQSVNGPEVTVINGQDTVRCVYQAGSNAVIRGFSITGGKADKGGGILVEGGRVENCLIYANQATNNYASLPDGGSIFYAGSGGGIKIENGVVRNCVIRDNQAGGGGGVYAVDALVENCQIVSNTSYTDWKVSGGGGVYAAHSTIRNCVISDNIGDVEGGGVVCLQTGLVENCTIEGNDTWLFGGGISASQDSIIRNCLLRGNRAQNGAGGWLSGCLLDHCTVTENISDSSHDEAGGISAIRNSLIRNSIIVMNLGNGDPALQNVKDDGTALITYTLSEPLQAGEGNLAGDPLFADLIAGNYHLQANSPCIDAASMTNSLATDLNGIPRPLDGNGDGVAISDMGAYERVCFSYADASRADDSGDGLTWATAKKTLQAAVNVVDMGGHIWVTNGVYDQGRCKTPGGNWTNRVCMTNAKVMQSVNGPEVTVIDGLDAVRGVFMTNGCSLVGFTVTNGWVSYYLWNQVGCGFGAGVYMGDLCVVSNCHINGNQGGWKGAGAYGGTLYNCEIRGNRGSYTGGGAEQCQLIDCVIIGNSGVSVGGGAYFSTLRNCIISSNSCIDYGGGAASSTLSNCALCGNSANAGAGAGAANSSLYYCQIINNQARDGGGVLGGILNSCTLISNMCQNGYGGGAYHATLNNCVLVGNEQHGSNDWSGTKGGGGAYDSTLNNCSVYDNKAEALGGGVYRSELHSCIVWGNSNEDIRSCSIAENTCASDGITHGANGCITNNPLFVNAANGDYHLQAGSPCIDAGNPSNRVFIDLDGVPRPLDGDGNGSAISDMGAYEYMLAAADSDRDGVNDGDECSVYGTNPTQSDSDGDGQSDRDEIVARMDPNDPDSFFAVRQMTAQQRGVYDLVLEWPTSAECTYTLYRCESLTGDWTAVPGWIAVPGTGETMSYTVPEGSELRGFYRVKSEVNP